MRNWINLIESVVDEAIMDRPWPKTAIKSIDDIAQERYERIKAGFSPLGSITDNQGQRYEVVGVTGDRFYAIKDDVVAGYLTMSAIPAHGVAEVEMLFVRPQFQKRGIAGALYRFALSHGVTIMCDQTLTKGSRAIWQSLIRDPGVVVTMAQFNRYDTGGTLDEKPIKDAAEAFRKNNRDYRMIARKA